MDQPNSTVVTSSFTSPMDLHPTEFHQPIWTVETVFRVAIYSLCIIVGGPGNIAVIILKPNWKNLNSLSRSLMLNLAVSDLLCMLAVLPWIYTFICGWPYRLVACKLLVYIPVCTVYASLLTVTVLSLQRYFVVVLQRRCHQLPQKVLPVLIWLAALVLSIPDLVIYNLNVDPSGKTECVVKYSSDEQWLAVLLSEVLVGFTSLSIVSFTYIQIHCKLKQGVFFNNAPTSRLVTCVIGTFIILWLPFHTINVMTVIAVFQKSESLKRLCIDAWGYVVTIVVINSSINPLLYAFASKKCCSVCQKRTTSDQSARKRKTVKIATISGP